jgi:hypothetical protein
MKAGIFPGEVIIVEAGKQFVSIHFSFHPNFMVCRPSSMAVGGIKILTGDG